MNLAYKNGYYHVPVVKKLQFTYCVCKVDEFWKSAVDRANTNEPSRGKNQQCGFRTGPTQTGLYKHRKELEA